MFMKYIRRFLTPAPATKLVEVYNATFDPMPDITAYELVKLLPYLMNDDSSIDDSSLEQGVRRINDLLEEGVKRHFKEIPGTRRRTYR